MGCKPTKPKKNIPITNAFPTQKIIQNGSQLDGPGGYSTSKAGPKPIVATYEELLRLDIRAINEENKIATPVQRIDFINKRALPPA